MGGIVADSFSLTLAFACEVVLLCFAAIFFSRIATDTPVPTGRHVFHDLADGLRYISHSPSMVGVLLLGAIPGMLLIGPFAVTVVAMAKDVLESSDKFVGFLWGAFGAGILLGSIGLSFIRLRPRGFFLCVAVFLGGATMAAYGASSSVPLSMAALLIGGAIGPAIFINFGVALLQENVDRNMMGRVMSMWGLVFTVSSAIGYFQAGVVASTVGPQAAVIASASIAAACGLLAMLFLRPVTRLA